MPRSRARLSVDRLEDRCTPATHPLTSIPALHSLPASASKLYLDFDGDDGNLGFSHTVTPAYDKDGDPTTFSDAELADIRATWEAVAEDYAPFAVDVTTVDPGTAAGVFSSRIVVGGDGTWYTSTHGSAGGVANLGVFGDTPVIAVGYVFSTLYSNPADLSYGISHESGHTFGLSHQSVWQNGTKTDEYNPGSGNWGPIMGSAYSKQLSTWFNGTSNVSPNTFQDDIAVIAATIAGVAGGTGFRPDDYGNDTAHATPIPAGSPGSITGLVNSPTDADVFSFTTTATGPVTAHATGDAVAPNLDAALELRNASGTLLASDNPTDAIDAVVVKSLPAGTYFLTVKSNGVYGRIGQYTLNVATTGTPPKASLASPAVVDPTVGMSSLTVAFDQPMDESSFSTGDDIVSFTAPDGSDLKSNVTGSTWADDQTLTVNFFNKFSQGTYTMVFDPRVFAANGQALDQNGNGTPGETTADRFTAKVTIGPFKDFEEPNDTTAAATDLGIVSGSTSFSGLTIHLPTDADFFKVTADGYGPVTATATPDAGAGDVDVAVLDADGNVLATKAGSGGAAVKVAATVAIDQVVFVRVTGHAGTLVNRYSLEVLGPPFADLSLFGTGSVTEFRPGGVNVGTLSAFSSANHTYKYSLVTGTGSDDNGGFKISGDQLLTNAAFDAAVDPTLSVRIRATDEAGGFLEKVFTIPVADDKALSLKDRVFYVAGTAGGDSFAFAAGTTAHSLNLNGTVLAVMTAEVDALVYTTGGGSDTVDLVAAGTGNVAAMTPTYGVLQGKGYAFYAVGVGRLSIHGGAGDTAYLAGSDGNDTLTATPTFNLLSGAGYSNTAIGFGGAVAYAGTGNDTATYFGSDGNDTFVGTPTYSVMVGAGYANYAVGFDAVSASAGAGADSAFLADSAGIDTLTAGGPAATLTGTGFTITVSGFDGVVAFGTAGGKNKKTVGTISFFLDTPGDWTG